MEGWRLNEGKLLDNSKINLFSIVTKSLLSAQFKTTTYKYCFFKSLLDNIHHCDKNYILSFDDIGYTFAQTYWNIINVYHVPQKYKSNREKASEMELLVDNIVKSNPSLHEARFEALSESVSFKYIKTAQQKFQNYVIGAFYAETGGYLYGFSKKSRFLTFNSISYNFLIKHKIILEQFCYYEWLKLCESMIKSRNMTIPNNLPQILEDITKRNDLSKFKDKLDMLLSDRKCFYDGVDCTKSATLDHVIPWSYLKQDELWNLVWCCPRCNSSKNNRIPVREYLDKLVVRNKELGIKSPDIIKLSENASENGIENNWRPKKR